MWAGFCGCGLKSGSEPVHCDSMHIYTYTCIYVLTDMYSIIRMNFHKSLKQLDFGLARISRVGWRRPSHNAPTAITKLIWSPRVAICARSLETPRSARIFQLQLRMIAAWSGLPVAIRTAATATPLLREANRVSITSLSSQRSGNPCLSALIGWGVRFRRVLGTLIAETAIWHSTSSTDRCQGRLVQEC